MREKKKLEFTNLLGYIRQNVDMLILVDLTKEWAVIGKKWITKLPQKAGSWRKIIHY